MTTTRRAPREAGSARSALAVLGRSAAAVPRRPARRPRPGGRGGPGHRPVRRPGHAPPLPNGSVGHRCWGYPPPTRPVDRPGGPTIVVTQGDTVTITLHNTLGASRRRCSSRASRCRPDRTGVAAGGTRDVHLHRRRARHLPLRGRPAAQHAVPDRDGPARRPRGASDRADTPARPTTTRARRTTTTRCSCSARSTPR